MRRLSWTAPLVVLTVTFACMGTPGDSGGKPPPAPARSSAPAVSALDAWKGKGADAVPPAAVRQVALGTVAVSNETGGAVTEADARAWATALLRSSSYDDWALAHLQDGFLLRSGLSSAPRIVFAGELGHIQAARAAGAHLEVTPQTIRRLVLRPVPESMRQQFAAQLMTWSPYAFYVDKTGPSQLTYVDAAGARSVKSQVAAGVGVPELFAGQLVHDDVLGDVWRLDSDFDCGSPASRSQLASVCAP